MASGFFKGKSIMSSMAIKCAFNKRLYDTNADDVIYYNFQYFNGKEKITKDEYISLFQQGNKDVKKIPFIIESTVFNGSQITGIDFVEKHFVPKKESEKIETCENIIKSFVNIPKIEQSRDGGASYSPSLDRIKMPDIKFFDNEQEYYGTLFHEIAHSTGHKSRLDRGLEKFAPFGSKEYAFEELVAELTAVYLCAESGIMFFTLNNSAAYIQSWNKTLVDILKDDTKFIFRAAAEAQRAVDYILKDYKDNELITEIKPFSKIIAKEIEISKTSELQGLRQSDLGYTITFEGIKIIVHCETERHHTPHFHVLYSGHKASIDIETLEIIVGSLPNNIYKKIKSWAELKQIFLLEKYNELNKKL